MGQVIEGGGHGTRVCELSPAGTKKKNKERITRGNARKMGLALPAGWRDRKRGEVRV